MSSYSFIPLLRNLSYISSLCLPFSLSLVCLSVFFCVSVSVSLSPLSILMASFNLNYSLKAQSPDTVTLKLRLWDWAESEGIDILAYRLVWSALNFTDLINVSFDPQHHIVPQAPPRVTLNAELEVAPEQECSSLGQKVANVMGWWCPGTHFVQDSDLSLLDSGHN